MWSAKILGGCRASELCGSGLSLGSRFKSSAFSASLKDPRYFGAKRLEGGQLAAAFEGGEPFEKRRRARRTPDAPRHFASICVWLHVLKFAGLIGFVGA